MNYTETRILEAALNSDINEVERLVSQLYKNELNALEDALNLILEEMESRREQE